MDIKALCENYLLENGVLCDETDRIKNDEWRRGLQMEEYLHKTLIDVATPDMTFEELYYFMNDVIETIKDYQMLKCLPLNRTSVFLIPNMDIREKISIILTIIS